MSDEGDRERAPLDGLAESVEERRKTEQSEAGGITEEFLDDLFEDHDVDDLDDVWDQLDTKAVDDVETVTRSGVEYSVVDKRRYCQRCQYFSDPPSTTCEYDGASIDAVVDSTQFRVASCPIVSGEAQLTGK